MKKKIIYIIIESVKRELNSKTLFALKALKKNYRVLIGQKGALREVVKDTNPGIMFLKSFGPKNTSHIDFIKKRNFKIISTDEELITAIDLEDKIEYRMNNENLSKLDVFLAVGETSDLPVYKKKFGNSIKNILVCGNMRLELLKEKYIKILENESVEIKKKYGDYILFLTGFHLINKIHPKYRIDWVFERIVEQNIDPDSNSIFLANETIKMQREALIQTIKFINNFEKKFPNRKLIISPHPKEKIDFWKNYIKIKKFKNILINTDLLSSSHALINSCDILISSNSTTILEGYFCKKKIINLLGNKERVSEINLLKKISKVVRSADQLVDVIKNIENEDIRIHNEELKEIRNFDNNFDSFESILQTIDNLEGVQAYDSLYKNFYFIMISKLRMIKNIIKKFISYKLNLNPMIKRFNKEKIGDRMSKKNFVKNLENINNLENTKNLKINQIAPNVYLLDSIKN
jgi:surface carbohydrate biosynthesis protein